MKNLTQAFIRTDAVQLQNTSEHRCPASFLAHHSQMSAYTYVVHHVSLEAKGRAKYFSHHMMSQNGIPGDARQAPTKSPGTMEKTRTPIVLSKLIGPQAKQKKLAHLAGQSFHMVAIPYH